MAVPENNVFVDGGAPVDGDALNTFVQTCNTMADLRAFIGTSGMQVSVLGQNAVNDGNGGTFYWNATGTAPDDNGISVVLPSGSVEGEWVRVAQSTTLVPVRITHIIPDPTATASFVGVMMGTGETFTPASTGFVLITFYGTVSNNVQPNGALIQMYYGMGSPPSNGDVLQGALIGAVDASVGVNNEQIPFAITAVLGSLLLGTTYWVDVSLAAIIGGTVNFTFLHSTIVEI